MSFKFNYIFYQIKKNIAWINKIDSYVRTNLIIYIIVMTFNYLIYIYNMLKHIIHKIIFINNIYFA